MVGTWKHATEATDEEFLRERFMVGERRQGKEAGWERTRGALTSEDAGMSTR